MTSLLYNPHTQKLLRTTLQNMPHALLLEGPVGAGLLATAMSLSGKDLYTIVEPTDTKGELDKESGSIKITQIRELYETTKGISTRKRFIIIDDADTMGKPAQNAFLKLLEEPTPNTFFILTAHQPEKLLPTIISRVQRLRIGKISAKQTQELIERLGVTDDRKKSQLLFVAEGLPAEIARLASDAALFTNKVRFMTDARSFLQGSTVEKLGIVNAYHLKRIDALHMLEAAQTILLRTIETRPSKDMIALVNTLADTYEKIAANGNVRLHLLAVVV